MMPRSVVIYLSIGLLASLLGLSCTWADEPAAKQPVATNSDEKAPFTPSSEPEEEPVEPEKLPVPKGAKRLSPDGKFDAWIDKKRGVVILDGQVSLRRGLLEMFACTRGTKEHESVVSVNSRAMIVHAALLTLGAEAGSPVAFTPKYRPPTGTEIAIEVRWLDEKKKWQSVTAQQWVRNADTKKQLKHKFVFAGSGFWKDPNGKSHYQAEVGDFICVTNFSSAMLDIPVASTQANEGLYYEAFTERIPALGTPVRLLLKPVLKKKEKVQKVKHKGTKGTKTKTKDRE